ncbi:DegT/DnrJ/EryC1/StrS family aminotransferase [Campylobacter hyointestinalis]|uniref:DegT/DnrJ/EryC1/StrS aminotransferase family protein n=1 Tax=Campylobacter hyointestinalis subsp. hyointestinalis TaxID=91352 RepID=A0A855NBJ4_CAMHY|nr:DegT/DnrJ/EryC1/StrS family aminotransferase [Campylobacter hyointestinalis]PPB57884.1 hypothetical protein CDQ70_06370 [Campylobacter hyointestinalis subsp. hyointestinalis]PPB64410.1 hypothetical protein CDQ74_02835 [Campylobacter hyointestinalis subsp. hyointestinalis]PPB72147.1 hypothetical protein CDQ78_04215 [Campylobacter hyointestinalis subsp. hyointestinalis]
MSIFKLQKSGRVNLNEIYKDFKIYLYPYARYAFLETLKTLNIKSIYIPSFICRDMLAPINTLGIKYYFYDLDIKLNPILKDIRCDAILMVNYFGFAANLSIFEKYKSVFNSIIIEDNAHGFLSRDENERLLGTRGDIGLLSIRKTIFLPNGGAVLINNPKFKDLNFQSAICKTSSEDLKYNNKCKLKKCLILSSFGIFIVLLRRFIRYLKSGNAIPLPDLKSEENMPNQSNLTPKLKDMNIDIDIIFEINRRRSLYFKVCKYAKLFEIEPIYQLNDFTVPFEFAFIDNGRYRQFQRYLYLKGLFVLPWPDLPDEITDKSPKFYKNVKVVPFLW